ncbi:hypothetical protein Pla52n_62090 [Stieleria varia]|uniref:Uncharacterized protein n=1 Tax=Stieleria varia TaxID=2528005 RepID=A0A5C5ZZ12_9BACT|nr:hypothetical protein Pla52n_62090 [Stieleria varia]
MTWSVIGESDRIGSRRVSKIKDLTETLDLKAKCRFVGVIIFDHHRRLSNPQPRGNESDGESIRATAAGNRRAGLRRHRKIRRIRSQNLNSRICTQVQHRGAEVLDHKALRNGIHGNLSGTKIGSIDNGWRAVVIDNQYFLTSHGDFRLSTAGSDCGDGKSVNAFVAVTVLNRDVCGPQP